MVTAEPSLGALPICSSPSGVPTRSIPMQLHDESVVEPVHNSTLRSSPFPFAESISPREQTWPKNSGDSPFSDVWYDEHETSLGGPAKRKHISALSLSLPATDSGAHEP